MSDERSRRETIIVQADRIAELRKENTALEAETERTTALLVIEKAHYEREYERAEKAEAEVARLKNLNVLQAHLLSDANRRARDERERCARVVEARLTRIAPGDPYRIKEPENCETLDRQDETLVDIAAAIRAGT